MRTLDDFELAAISGGDNWGSEPADEGSSSYGGYGTGSSGGGSGASSSSTPQGAATWVGAITGAAMCFGTPLVPFCAATGGLIGTNVPGNNGSGGTVGGGGNISDIIAP